MIEPVATGATTLVWRHGSRAFGLEMCTSSDRTVEGGQRVVQRPGVVGEGTGVDEDGRAASPGAVDGVDQLALVVGLEGLDVAAVAAAAVPRGLAT